MTQRQGTCILMIPSSLPFVLTQLTQEEELGEGGERGRDNGPAADARPPQHHLRPHLHHQV